MAVTVAGKSLKQLREDRATLITNARGFLDQHEADWTDDRQSQYNAMLSDASDYTAAIQRRESLQELSPESNATIPSEDPRTVPGARALDRPDTVSIRSYNYDASGNPVYIDVPAGKRGTQEHKEAFSRYLKFGANGLTPDERAALQSDDAPQAGYLNASEQFASELLKEVDDLLFVRRYARVHTVPNADSLGIRKRTAKMSSAAWGEELADVSANYDSTLAIGKKILTPEFLTQGIKVSRDLVRRSVVPIDQMLREEMARDAGELMEDAYLTGDGADKPLGVFTASSDGISTSRDVVTGSNTSILADSLRTAKYTLKSQYREGQRGPVRWLFHRDAIAIISKLKDGESQYLWRPGLTENEPDTLLGFPVDESERAPNTFTETNYCGLLANWRYYEIADALEMDMLVLTEKYAETNQIAYVNRIKTDGMPTLEEAFVRLVCDT